MGRRTRPEVYHGLVSLAIVAALAVLLFLAFPLHSWYLFLAAWLLAVNVVTFGYYGYDKSRARSCRSRIPEATLHGLVPLLGGTLGAWLGMKTFRHKTIKPSFRLIFWIIVVLQGAMIAGVIYRLLKGGG